MRAAPPRRYLWGPSRRPLPLLSLAPSIGMLIRVLVVVLCFATAHPSDAQTPTMRRNPASMSGLAGLINVPSAAGIPSGVADLTFDNARTPHLGPVEQQRNMLFSIGFLPRLTLGGRVALYRIPPEEEYVGDHSLNLQLLLREEGDRMPAIAIGVFDPDLGGNPVSTNHYVTASKTWSRSRLTAGYGAGPKRGRGIFGGVELDLAPWAAALAEYDGDRFNGGLRVFPLFAEADRLGMQPRVDVAWQDGIGAVVGVGLRTVLGGKRQLLRDDDLAAAGADAPADVRTPVATLRAPRAGAVAAQAHLVGLGLENTRVWIEDEGRTIAVEYENRVFNRDEMDALGVVMGVAALQAPESVARMRVTVRRVDLPVLTVESDVESFRGFVEQRVSAESFAAQLVISTPGGDARRPGGAENAPSNSSRWKLDVHLEPRVDALTATELGIGDMRLAVLPDAYLQLGRGFVLNGRLTVSVHETEDFPGFLEDGNADRLLLHKAMRIPLGRDGAANAIMQFSAGWFRHDAVGLGHETDVSFGEGRWSVGSTLAFFGPSIDEPDHTVALGSVRARHPGWDLAATVTAGRFRAGDNGASAEVSRFFGANELAFYLRSTNRATVAGLRLEIPLAPARDLPPSRVRLRFPTLYFSPWPKTLLQRTAPRRPETGRLLETNHEIARVYRTRDRLHPARIRSDVDILRDAVRRWLGDGTLLTPSIGREDT